jgi:uncharacterized protein (DUF362 family)
VDRRVAFARVERGDVEAAVRRAVSLAGGIDDLVRNSRVLVKPNLWSAQRSGTGSTTDSRVTEAVTRIVLEHGPCSVVIGEGCGAGYDGFSHSTEEAFELSGTGDAARRLGVELRNLNADESVEVEIPGALIMDRVKISRTALESDVIISVPVLKTHIRTDVTLSLKNMKGVIPGVEKRKTHRLGLDQAIVDLNSVVGPHFVVLDATVGMQGLWSYPRDSVEVGLIGAGSHALSVDIAGATLMGVEPNEVLHLRHRAEQEGLAPTLDGVELVGDDIGPYRRTFKTGFQVFAERFPQVNIVRGESACTGCTTELVTALRYLNEAGYSPEMGGLTIVIGEVDSVPASDKVALLGKCARMHAGLGVHAAGCPPAEESVIRTLCAACGADAAKVLETRDRARERMWGETKSKLDS